MKRIFFTFFCLVFLVSLAPAQSITVAKPNGGENWPLNSSQQLTWGSRGITGNVNIVLFQGDTRIGLIKANVPIAPGSFTWENVGTLPGGTVVASGSNYKIKVRSQETGWEDMSDNPFTISPALLVAPLLNKPLGFITTVRVTYPNQNSLLYIGQEKEIRWEHAHARPDQRMKVSLVRYTSACRDESSAEVIPLGGMPVNAGRMIWEISPIIHPCENCIIRLSPVTPGDFFEDTSDECFALRERATIRILAPNDGEIFHYGSRIPIRWEAANAYPSMRIVVSLMCCGTGCTYGTKLADLYSDSRELNWLIENRTPAGQYRIRCAVVTGIVGSYHTEVEDYSDTCFTIM